MKQQEGHLASEGLELAIPLTVTKSVAINIYILKFGFHKRRTEEKEDKESLLSSFIEPASQFR